MNHVARVDRSGLVRIELRRPLTKKVEPKDDESAIDVGLAMFETANDRVLLSEAAGSHRLPIQRLDRVGGKRIGRRQRLGFDTAAHRCDVSLISNAERRYR